MNKYKICFFFRFSRFRIFNVNLKKIEKNFFFGNFEQKKYVNFFYFFRWASPPEPPIGAAPLDPAYFWIEDYSQNRFALNGIQELPASVVFGIMQHQNKIIFFKRAQIYMKDPQSAESK